MRFGFAVAAAWLAVGLALTAAKPPARQVKVLDDVLACRPLTDGAARLACFDRTTASLGVATERKDVVVVDRQQVQQARQSLFGFALPRLSILGFGGKEEDGGPTEITATVRSVRQDQEGQWVLVLADGAVWHQTDQTRPFHDPHAGSTAVIRRAALGTYFMRIDGHMGFRARRES